MPAATVILNLAPLAYIKVIAVKLIIQFKQNYLIYEKQSEM